MLTKIYSISMLLTFLSVDLNKCRSNPGENEIIVVGTALVLKHHAAVRTDDSILYVLDGIDDWKDKYLGKRVKVTGELLIKEYEYTERNDSIKIIPQEDYSTQRIIKKPKWSLVE
jgi:hypothetical protein